MKKTILIILMILTSVSLSYAYSGLIIDATSSPSPQPIYFTGGSSTGTPLNNDVLSDDINHILEKGIICYTGSIDAAKRSGFVGKDPFIVRVNSRFDEKEITNIIIPTDDAKEIIKISRRPGYLGNLKIAIIL
ncbi:hypothetical protein ACFLZ2_00145 [Candidatus Margulisiibacteriota bacterium]